MASLFCHGGDVCFIESAEWCLTSDVRVGRGVRCEFLTFVATQSVGRTVGWSVGRSIIRVGRTMGRAVGRSVGRSVSRFVGRSVSRSNRSVDGRSIGRSIYRSILRSGGRSAGRSIYRSVGRTFGRSAVWRRRVAKACLAKKVNSVIPRQNESNIVRWSTTQSLSEFPQETWNGRSDGVTAGRWIGWGVGRPLFSLDWQNAELVDCRSSAYY